MTSDDMLSQDEINALLNVANEEETASEEESAQTNAGQSLDALELDTLGEIGNISLGSSATTLSTLLGQKVEITTPEVSLVRKTGIKETFPYEHVTLQVNYVDGFDGENLFLLKATDAAIISDLMLGGEGNNPKQELTEIELSAVQEAMNQMMGASATSMSTVFNKRVDISPPLIEYKEIDKLEEVGEVADGDVFIRVSFKLKIGDLVDSEIMQLIPQPFAKTLVDQLLNPAEEEAAATAVAEKPTAPPTQPSEQVKTDPAPTVAPDPAPSHAQPQQQSQSAMPPPQMDASGTQQIGNMNAQSTMQAAAFSNFSPVDLPENNRRNLDMLLDIPLKVTVELGRTKKRIQEILDLSPGSIVELDKLQGEPVDVLVNQKLVAKGEVVVIDENFGVRVTDIISQKERIMNLN